MGLFLSLRKRCHGNYRNLSKDQKQILETVTCFCASDSNVTNASFKKLTKTKLTEPQSGLEGLESFGTLVSKRGERICPRLVAPAIISWPGPNRLYAHLYKSHPFRRANHRGASPLPAASLSSLLSAPASSFSPFVFYV